MPTSPSHRITTIFGDVLPQTTQLRVTNKECVVKHHTILHIFRPVDQRCPLKIMTEERDKGSDPHKKTFRLCMYLSPRSEISHQIRRLHNWELRAAGNKLVHSSYSLRHIEDPEPFTRKDSTGIPRLFWDVQYTATAQTRQTTSRQILKTPSLLSKWQIKHVFGCAVFNYVSTSFERVEKFDYKWWKGKYVEGII